MQGNKLRPANAKQHWNLIAMAIALKLQLFLGALKGCVSTRSLLANWQQVRLFSLLAFFQSGKANWSWLQHWHWPVAWD